MIYGILSGNFDPIDVVDLDLIRRGLFLFQDIVIAVENNNNKKYNFSIEERLNLVKNAINLHFPYQNDHIHILSNNKCLFDFAKSFGKCCLIRGDHYRHDEHVLHSNLETIILPSNDSLSR